MNGKIKKIIRFLQLGLLPILFLCPSLFARIPSIFAPGVISGPAHESAPAFAPDGKTVYFSRNDAAHSTILVSHLLNGAWSKPEISSFSGEWNDMEPAMSPEGSYLVFVSNRPSHPNGKPIDGFYNGKSWPEKGGNLWRVDSKGQLLVVLSNGGHIIVANTNSQRRDVRLSDTLPSNLLVSIPAKIIRKQDSDISQA
jgi:hypothetical protein